MSSGCVPRRLGYATRAAVLLMIFPSLPAVGRPQQETAGLADQSIEDLMNIPVTSVSRTEQAVSRTASAIFVISRQDISRSGATNIPDLLRMVPGIYVAQMNGNTWAITARGFNARFANELLVLVDDRPVYTQTFGGVFWDVLDIPLDDIERIEVIRGPGSSIWGANAVNGVVNIMTKKASDTRGPIVVAGGGNIDQGFGTIQYGGDLWGATVYRAYMKYLNQDHLPDSAGRDGGDGWHMLQGGFRADSALSSKDALTIQGDIYTAREGTPTSDYPSVTDTSPLNIEIEANLGGGFIQGIWAHTLSAESDTTLQVSWDRYQRNDALGDSRRTFDIDFQNHFSGWKRQNIVWGLSYRYTTSNSDGNLFISLVPAGLAEQLFGSFLQDEVAILPDRLFLTVGAKLEHNYYTGFDVMPSARLAWIPSPHRTLWAAISKSDRTPSMVDASVRAALGGYTGPGGIPVLIVLTGNPHVKNEVSIAYELGYRATVLKQLSADFAAYYNNYNHQETTEPSALMMQNTPAPPHLVMPLIYENMMHGETHGVEFAVNWQPTHRWSLSPGYAFEAIHMRLGPTSLDTTSVSQAEGSTPGQSAQLRSHLLLWHGLSWDASAYFVGRLTGPSEPSYTRVDTELT